MKEYIRILVFSKNNLNGYFRYKDIFQIYPFSSKFMSIPEEADSKPLILEYCYENIPQKKNSDFLDRGSVELAVDSDLLYENSLYYNETKRLLNFLTVTTNNQFFFYTAKKNWIRDIASENSRIGYKEFNYEQLREEYPFKIAKFSENLPFPPIQVVDYDEYIIRGVLQPKESIVIHSEFNSLLNKYYALKEDNKVKIDSICTLYQEGLKLDGSSKSIPFVVFTSCIEALTDIEFEEQNKSIKPSCDCQTIDESPYRCKKCNKPIWGMSFKFKEILKRYAEDSETANKFYNRWYGIRSDIVHYGKLFLADTIVGWNNEEKLTEQSINLRKVRQVVRIAIINWMLNSTMAK